MKSRTGATNPSPKTSNLGTGATAKIGRYSVVWFDVLSTNGYEHISAYVSLAGTLLTTSCSPGSLRLRPGNLTTQYPPSIFGPDPEVFTIALDLGEKGGMELGVTIVNVLADGGPAYKRWSGNMTGRVCCGPIMTGGVAVLEQFKLV